MPICMFWLNLLGLKPYALWVFPAWQNANASLICIIISFWKFCADAWLEVTIWVFWYCLGFSNYCTKWTCTVRWMLGPGTMCGVQQHSYITGPHYLGSSSRQKSARAWTRLQQCFHWLQLLRACSSSVACSPLIPALTNPEDTCKTPCPLPRPLGGLLGWSAFLLLPMFHLRNI